MTTLGTWQHTLRMIALTATPLAIAIIGITLGVQIDLGDVHIGRPH
ncbi:hypothetical protein [Amycolatopsis sp. SID8362]|nr:hypothetical protein [Amycolatopsis sp. SID8362]NBH02874.1 hypothetical protein [Amycolatopsis sp. SID8362]NED39575.1 hypothetical protein [Amycolatopsis sp. SID8362]